MKAKTPKDLSELAEKIGALTILNTIGEKYKTQKGDIFIPLSEYIKLCAPYNEVEP